MDFYCDEVADVVWKILYGYCVFWMQFGKGIALCPVQKYKKMFIEKSMNVFWYDP